MPYTTKQLQRHGELILAHINNDNLRWRCRSHPQREWTLMDKQATPNFYIQYDYEIAEPIAEVDGTRLYEGDMVYWFDCIKGEVISQVMNGGFTTEETHNTTKITTSHAKALALGKKKLLEYFNQQFELKPAPSVKEVEEQFYEALNNLRTMFPCKEITVQINDFR